MVQLSRKESCRGCSRSALSYAVPARGLHISFEFQAFSTELTGSGDTSDSGVEDVSVHRPRRRHRRVPRSWPRRNQEGSKQEQATAFAAVAAAAGPPAPPGPPPAPLPARAARPVWQRRRPPAPAARAQADAGRVHGGGGGGPVQEPRPRIRVPPAQRGDGQADVRLQQRLLRALRRALAPGQEGGRRPPPLPAPCRLLRPRAGRRGVRPRRRDSPRGGGRGARGAEGAPVRVRQRGGDPRGHRRRGGHGGEAEAADGELGGAHGGAPGGGRAAGRGGEGGEMGDGAREEARRRGSGVGRVPVGDSGRAHGEEARRRRSCSCCRGGGLLGRLAAAERRRRRRVRAYRRSHQIHCQGHDSRRNRDIIHLVGMGHGLARREPTDNGQASGRDRASHRRQADRRGRRSEQDGVSQGGGEGGVPAPPTGAAPCSARVDGGGGRPGVRDPGQDGALRQRVGDREGPRGVGRRGGGVPAGAVLGGRHGGREGERLSAHPVRRRSEDLPRHELRAAGAGDRARQPRATLRLGDSGRDARGGGGSGHDRGAGADHAAASSAAPCCLQAQELCLGTSTSVLASEEPGSEVSRGHERLASEPLQDMRIYHHPARAIKKEIRPWIIHNNNRIRYIMTQ